MSRVHVALISATKIVFRKTGSKRPSMDEMSVWQSLGRFKFGCGLESWRLDRLDSNSDDQADYSGGIS